MKTHPAMLAERIKVQAGYRSQEPVKLLLEELLDMTRAYMLALEILQKESPHEDSTGR